MGTNERVGKQFTFSFFFCVFVFHNDSQGVAIRKQRDRVTVSSVFYATFITSHLTFLQQDHTDAENNYLDLNLNWDFPLSITILPFLQILAVDAVQRHGTQYSTSDVQGHVIVGGVKSGPSKLRQICASNIWWCLWHLCTLWCM